MMSKLLLITLVVMALLGMASATGGQFEVRREGTQRDSGQPSTRAANEPAMAAAPGPTPCNASRHAVFVLCASAAFVMPLL